jgi:predicted branched-subunit amino acid permease
MALIPVMIATINSRSTLLAVVVSAVLALLCFDLPYRLSLVVAVVGAIAAGMASDDLATRAALRGIRRRKPAVADATAPDAPPGDRA